MLELLEAACTPMIGGRPVVAELFFALEKGADLRRVILDRRRRSAMEKSLSRIFGELLAAGALEDEEYLQLMRLATLPHPSQLADIVAAPGFCRRTSPSSIAASFGRGRVGTRMPSARSSGLPSSRPQCRTTWGGATLSRLRG